MTEIERLKQIVEKLRSEDGCPWDKVQTHSSLKTTVIEEAAEEEGLFTLDDVAKVVSDKMIRRHPHVFSGVEYASDEERRKSWEEIKVSEKEGKEWQEPYLKSAMDEAGELIEVAKKRKGFS